MDFRSILMLHSDRYPRMQAQDYVKLACQHALGCGHMVKDYETALARIYTERPDGEMGVRFEDIGNGLVRLYLEGTDAFFSNETIARMFISTANTFCVRENALNSALSTLRTCVHTKDIALSQANFEAFIAEYEKAGMPIVSHTNEYRSAYAPAYRVIKKEFQTYAKLYEALDSIRTQKPGAVIAIDGMCASGKTTLAAQIGKVFDASVFHMDDFFLPPEKRTKERLSAPGGNVDSERFLEEILLPLHSSEAFSYRPFDCSEMALASPVQAKPADLNIVEGAYACHPDLIGYYDYIVLITIDSALQQQRILARNGEDMLKRFINEWIPMEMSYLSHFRIAEKADITYSISESSI